MSQQTTSRQNRIAFGLCALLILLMTAGSLGFWIHRSALQRKSVLALRKETGVYYEFELDDDLFPISRPTPGPGWLDDWLGVDYLHTVRGLAVYEGADIDLAILNGIPFLRVLKLQDSGITDNGFEHLGVLKDLEKLEMFELGVTDVGLAVLPSLPAVRSLQLAFCEHVTDEGLDPVSRMPSLKRLEIFGNGFTNRGFAKLARIKTLEMLRTEFGPSTTDACLEQIAELPRLRRLELSYGDDHAIAGGLRFLDRFACLEELRLSGARDEALADLPLLPKLKTLEIYGPALTSDGLSVVRHLSNIEELAIATRGFDDAAALALEHLQALRSLTIDGDGCDLSDEGLAVIARIASLRTLRLNHCRYISDDGIGRLGDNPGLVEVQLDDMGPFQISSAAIDDLRARLPGCRIERD